MKKEHFNQEIYIQLKVELETEGPQSEGVWSLNNIT